jgi:riboflavin kinase/FMN adenylyltransferase
MEGREFIKLLETAVNARFMALGYDFRCGKGNDTAARDIARWNAERGIETEVLGPVMEGDTAISSTRIRNALDKGNNALAEKMLGRS